MSSLCSFAFVREACGGRDELRRVRRPGKPPRLPPRRHAEGTSLHRCPTPRGMARGRRVLHTRPGGSDRDFLRACLGAVREADRDGPGGERAKVAGVLGRLAGFFQKIFGGFKKLWYKPPEYFLKKSPGAGTQEGCQEKKTPVPRSRRGPVLFFLVTLLAKRKVSAMKKNSRPSL